MAILRAISTRDHTFGELVMRRTPRYHRPMVDRRRFLELATACATTLWLPRSAWSQPRLRSDPFALGVASGSPTHESIVLWTRIARSALPWPGSGELTVRWELADDDKFKRIVRKGQAIRSEER